MSTRRGKRISRRACDLCRDRKVQCLFDSQDAPSCRKCSESQVPCTFLTGRRPRGPPNRCVYITPSRLTAYSADVDDGEQSCSRGTTQGTPLSRSSVPGRNYSGRRPPATITNWQSHRGALGVQARLSSSHCRVLGTRVSPHTLGLRARVYTPVRSLRL